MAVQNCRRIIPGTQNLRQINRHNALRNYRDEAIDHDRRMEK